MSETLKQCILILGCVATRHKKIPKGVNFFCKDCMSSVSCSEYVSCTSVCCPSDLTLTAPDGSLSWALWQTEVHAQLSFSPGTEKNKTMPLQWAVSVRSASETRSGTLYSPWHNIRPWSFFLLLFHVIQVRPELKDKWGLTLKVMRWF